MEYKDDKETFDYAETLAEPIQSRYRADTEPIQSFADVIEKELIQTKEIKQ